MLEGRRVGCWKAQIREHTRVFKVDDLLRRQLLHDPVMKRVEFIKFSRIIVQRVDMGTLSSNESTNVLDIVMPFDAVYDQLLDVGALRKDGENVSCCGSVVGLPEAQFQQLGQRPLPSWHHHQLTAAPPIACLGVILFPMRIAQLHMAELKTLDRWTEMYNCRNANKKKEGGPDRKSVV